MQKGDFIIVNNVDQQTFKTRKAALEEIRTELDPDERRVVAKVIGAFEAYYPESEIKEIK